MLCNGQELTIEETFSIFDGEDMIDQTVDMFGIGVNVIDEEAQFEVDEDGVPEELVGFSVVRKRDHEVEVEYFDIDDHGFVVKVVDDGASVDQPYFTRSGDRPVLRSEAEQHDMKGKRFFTEIYAPKKRFYSAATMRWGDVKVQERNFHKVVRWIHRNKENTTLLSKGWKRFWKNVYDQKQPCEYMFPKQITCVKKLFEEYGVSSKSKR